MPAAIPIIAVAAAATTAYTVYSGERAASAQRDARREQEAMQQQSLQQQQQTNQQQEVIQREAIASQQASAAEQARIQKEALALQERQAVDTRKAQEAEAIRMKQVEETQQTAINKAASRAPDSASLISQAQQKAKGGVTGTMLTGPTGVDPASLSLGKSTLLGG